MPSGPMNSGPIRCWAAAEIFRSSQTDANTLTVAATSTISIGKGNQSALAAPGGMLKPLTDSIKVS